MITVHVPEMTARADARVVSASISDVPGVRTLRVDLATRTVRVSGAADPAAITAAVTACGYHVDAATTDARSGDVPGESPRARQLFPISAPHDSSQRSTPMLSDTSGTFVGPTTFAISGMTCSHCERAVTEEISAVEGVESVAVDLAGGTVTVVAARPVGHADIAAAVDEAGYVLVP